MDTLPFQLAPVETIANGVRLQEIVSQEVSWFSMNLFTVSPHACTPIDKHIEHEFWMVISGVGRLRYETSLMNMKQDEIFYFQPQRSHQAVNNGEQDLVVLSIYWL